MTDEQISEPIQPPADPQVAPDEPRPQYGVGPFTLREVVLVGIWLVAFVVSFFPLYSGVLGRALSGGASLWTAGLDWILTIGVPTVAVFLLVLRRLSPQGIRRVGSLGIDQFASVAFSVAAVVWLTAVWSTTATAIETGYWIRSWVMWVEFALALAGVVFTVCAPFIPPFREDFEERPEAPAHRSARPVRAVVARPRVERAAPPAPVDPYAPPAQPAPSDFPTDTAAYNELGIPADARIDTAPDAGAADAGLGAAADPGDAPQAEWTPQYSRRGAGVDDAPGQGAASAGSAPQTATVHQAFWALAPVERDVYDERGVPIFRIGPTAWALVIEDRGEVFVVRHEDGRIGYLHDVGGMTRG